MMTKGKEWKDMGYTKFGKAVRKFMIDKDETLGDLAILMDVSTAFISSVLTGKKKVPEDWYGTICDHYNLNENERKNLYDAYCDTKTDVKIDMGGISLTGKKIALQFQRRLPELNEDDLKSIREILGEGDDGL